MVVSPSRVATRPRVVRSALFALLLFAFPTRFLAAQTLDDGLLVPKRTAMLGVFYGHDSWDHYWEGTLERTNGNIGTLTTQSATVMAGYGVTRRLTLLASLPYVWTHASQGTLEGMHGLQDLTVAAKFRVYASDTSGRGLSAFVVGVGAIPASNYTPDFMPLSIGSAGARAAARATVSYANGSSWFATASGGFTFCNNVRLDRSSYYTDGKLYLTNEVAMPNVADYTITAGYRRGRLEVPVALTQQQTHGGADIRRQDMPFVSDRMDFTRVGAAVQYGLPRNLMVRVGAARVLTGRNVGHSTTYTSGLIYALPF